MIYILIQHEQARNVDKGGDPKQHAQVAQCRRCPPRAFCGCSQETYKVQGTGQKAAQFTNPFFPSRP